MVFVPLQVTSSYSLLQSTTRISELAKVAKQRGFSSLALTDNNIMYGLVDFYNACRKEGLKPILGLKLDLFGALDSTNRFPVIFLAKDQIGYQHLMKISTAKNTQTEETDIFYSQITEFMAHLYIIFPASNSELVTLVERGDSQSAQKLLNQIQTVADAKSVLIGVNTQQSSVLQNTLQQLAKTTKTAVIALPEVNYLNATDHFATQVLRDIDKGETIRNPEQFEDYQGNNWLRPAADYEEIYRKNDLTASMDLTATIAANCNVTLNFKKPELPEFTVPDGFDSKTYLQKLTKNGLATRLSNKKADITAYQKRLTHELTVIDQMGFDDYFLIVWDVMNFAHHHDITTGPGRGSAAGSLVAYCLQITDVDPLEYDLLFERFLNPERAQMPDIDLDIPDNKRDEVLQYVHDKYGHSHVSQIITFGTLAAKQALRDVGRVFGMAPYEINQLSKLVPNVLKITLREAVEQSQKLENWLADSSKNKLLYTIAQQIEGLPRHYSTHAAGVVLSAQNLSDVVPLQKGSDELLLTQYPKDTVEALGLLKMDFLGLRNLSIMANAVRIITKTKNPQFKISDVTLNDQKTLRLFQNADTTGVFQFESAGIRNVLRQLHPETFELVAAVDALYRPGPMENIETFIKRKKGKELVQYPDSSLEPILKSTFGILVYQEQVMRVASVMGGFSLGEADLLRRAMSKKKRAVIDEMKTKFIAGALKRGYTQQTAKQVYDYIERFANYGFNKSHAVAYSKMAFELAYLKAHYPGAFFAALMNSVINNPSKIKLYLSEAKQHEVKVSAPDINESQSTFILKNDQIIFGLSCIKGVRRDFISDILTERKKNGKFIDLQAFLQRIPVKWLKQDLMEALIYAGSFDSFGYNRAELLNVLPDLLNGVALSGSSMSLFEKLTPKISKTSDLPLDIKLQKENEFLGAYLSGHPVEQFSFLRKQFNITDVLNLSVNQSVTCLLYINKIRIIRTKKGEQMAFVTGSDLTGEIDITVFPNQYQTSARILEKGKVILIQGKVDERNGLQVIANRIQLAEQIKVPSAVSNQRWVLRILEETPAIQTQLQQVLRTNPGTIPVLLFYPQTDKKVLLEKQFWTTNSDKTNSALTNLLGKGNVVLQSMKNTGI
ncbi:DNA polymerase III subunit alpha [Pediococcus ethanolidurans]|uniref:DNA polymerase III subunit alpha n=1 Tax=Pediococcus ethanolidurans TaxID=319653 RepID=UPI0021E77EB2|nr:DNA polymerase III subunit alpha [Pediococcus ethanolidurans]MCV3322110.1 DNA polymerase III subunit alpha [Pediococcus ethanolidurans]MCV3323256.1 DNA polymerase III subunit alpha [Pediococcus ethanolidurans]MCV3555118.1 DNA polymerase III subunit alpha [Pediococcus ethanolidurans]